MSQTQCTLVALSDQFKNCTVKYTRVDESDLSLNYSCRRYSKYDNVDVFPHRDTSQSTWNIVYTFCGRFAR